MKTIRNGYGFFTKVTASSHNVSLTFYIRWDCVGLVFTNGVMFAPWVNRATDQINIGRFSVNFIPNSGMGYIKVRVLRATIGWFIKCTNVDQ